MALLLGVVSTLFAAALGPALYGMVFAAPDDTMPLVDLLGKNYAAVIQQLFGITAFSTSWLKFYLPLFIVICALLRTTMTVGHVFMWERCGERVAMRLRDQLVELFLTLDPRQRQQKKNYRQRRKTLPRLLPSMFAWHAMRVRHYSVV